MFMLGKLMGVWKLWVLNPKHGVILFNPEAQNPLWTSELQIKACTTSQLDHPTH